MFKKIHLVIGSFIALYFLPFITHKIVFFPVVLIASFIPDLDSVIVPKKNYKTLRFLNSQSYREFMHSYTFCILLSTLLAFFYPILALPFFLGYSFHLFFDSLTVDGINPFWPLKVKTKGLIVPGKSSEKILMIILIILIILFILRYLF